MLQMHLRNSDLHTVLLNRLQNTQNEYKKFKETRDSRNICQNELDKASFQYYMAYENFKNLIRKTTSEKVLRDKTFNVVNHPKYNGYIRGLSSMVYRSFDKRFSDDAVTYTDKAAIKIYC